tara:strand:- start:17 stop:451 length:435 start_codon:yes stop_codon:yes gene_type:complete
MAEYATILDTPYDTHIKFYPEEDPPIIIVLLKPMLETHHKCQLSNKIFIDKFINIFNLSLEKNDKFQLEIDASKIFISDIQKNMNLIADLSNTLENTFPDKLNKCNIHNAPSTFTNIFSLVSNYISPEVKERIIVLPKIKSNIS